MAYTTINKSSSFQNQVLYTGNGSTQSVTGVGFQPDWTWCKQRNTARNHGLFDAVRGVTKILYSNDTSGQGTAATSLTSFNSDGFSCGGETETNQNGGTYASWNWKANGAGSSNTDGTINSTVSVNATSGFSIVSYTGSGSNGTVGHGLGSTPNVYIIKKLNGASTWLTYHSALGIGYHLGLNNGTAQNANDATFANNTAPNSSVVSLGTWGDLNGSGNPYIMYCFAEKQGYSKFGKYSAVGNVDGNFIYLGFKPSFFLAKRITDGTEPWIMFDNKRNPFNGVDKNLKPNLSEAEATQNPPSMDFLSNGIKFRNLDGTFSNTSGKEFIYMAFAEAPLVGTNNVPCTAR